MRSRLAFACALVLSACDEGPMPSQGDAERIALAVESADGEAATEIPFGAPFVVRVERSWPAGSRPSAFDERALAPLVVAQLDSDRSERGGWVRETRRFRAQAFVRDEVTIGPLRMLVTPLAGGAPSEHVCEPVTRKVRSSLASDADLAAEQPMELLRPERGADWSPLAFATVALAAVGLLVRGLRSSRRARTAAPVFEAPAEPAHDARGAALEAIASIGARSVDDVEFAAALAKAMREWAARRSRMRASTSTTEELCAALAASVGPVATQQFNAALSPCDLVKFARMKLGSDGRARSLAAARACVEASS